MSCEALLRLLPVRPVSVQKHSRQAWDKMNRTLGVTMPRDYREFIEEVGGVIIDKFILVYSPFAQGDVFNTVLQTLEQADQLRDGRDRFGIKYPVGVFPEPNGLVCWGGTSNGDRLTWERSRELRTVIAYDSKAIEVEWYHMSMTEFLVEVLTRRIVVPFFPPKCPTEPHSCMPYE
jgi:SMI1-KNR4 cell-wall